MQAYRQLSHSADQYVMYWSLTRVTRVIPKVLLRIICLVMMGRSRQIFLRLAGTRFLGIPRKIITGKSYRCPELCDHFELDTEGGGKIQSKEITFAPAFEDEMPDIMDLRLVGDISASLSLCHGRIQEFRNRVIASGNHRFRAGRNDSNWTNEILVV